MSDAFAKIVKRLIPKRRLAQFSLATLFLIVTVLCVWLTVVASQAKKQREAVAHEKTVAASSTVVGSLLAGTFPSTCPRMAIWPRLLTS